MSTDRNWWQFKMVSGEEILADVITFPDEEDPEQSVVCRDILEIQYMDLEGKGRLAYLRPYMVFQCDDPSVSSIQGIHIMVFSKPNAKLKSLGAQCVEAFRGEAASDFTADSLEDFLAGMEEMDGPGVFDEANGDSDTNVIKFDRNKLH